MRHRKGVVGVFPHGAYACRADSHLISVADQLSGTRTFDLDPIGRVTAVHAPDWTERYACDNTGNQTSAAWPTRHPGGEAAGSRTYTGTTITRAGDVRFEHDGLGRVTLRQKTRLSRKLDTWRYTWDTENRLTSATTPDGESVVEEVRFTWDGLTLCEQTSNRPDVPGTVALTWDHRDVVPLAQTERILTADVRQEEIDRRFFAIATDLGAPRPGPVTAVPTPPSGSPASTTTPRPATTPPRTPSASLPRRIPSDMWTTPTPGATRWV